MDSLSPPHISNTKVTPKSNPRWSTPTHAPVHSAAQLPPMAVLPSWLSSFSSFAKTFFARWLRGETLGSGATPPQPSLKLASLQDATVKVQQEEVGPSALTCCHPAVCCLRDQWPHTRDLFIFLQQSTHYSLPWFGSWILKPLHQN